MRLWAWVGAGVWRVLKSLACWLLHIMFARARASALSAPPSLPPPSPFSLRLMPPAELHLYLEDGLLKATGIMRMQVT